MSSAPRDFSNEPGFSPKDAVQVGGEITATVIRKDDGHGNILLSPRRGKTISSHGKTRTVQRRENHTGCLKVKGIVNAGVIAYVEGNPRLYPGIQAFPELCGRSERILKQRHSGSGFDLDKEKTV